MNPKAQRRRYGTTVAYVTAHEAKRQSLQAGVDEGGAHAQDARAELRRLAVHDYSDTRASAGRALTARAKGKTDIQTCKYFAAKNADPLARKVRTQ